MGSRGSIVVENLVREFRKGPRAVDGISLSVEPGEIYGFLGPNGAGKSTTVLMLTTLLPPTSGTARVAGYDIVKEGPQVRAGPRGDLRRTDQGLAAEQLPPLPNLVGTVAFVLYRSYHLCASCYKVRRTRFVSS